MKEKKQKTAVFFKTLRGDEPVVGYLTSIDSGDSGRIYALVEELELLGRLTEPHGKKLNSDIYEIRSGKHRILYAYHVEMVVLLHAFTKKRQKTDLDDINLAEKRFKLLKGD